MSLESPMGCVCVWGLAIPSPPLTLYICVFVCVRICVYVCVHLVCLCVCVCLCMYMVHVQYVCVSVCVCVFVFVSMQSRAPMFTVEYFRHTFLWWITNSAWGAGGPSQDLVTQPALHRRTGAFIKTLLYYPLLLCSALLSFLFLPSPFLSSPFLRSSPICHPSFSLLSPREGGRESRGL